MKRQFIIYLFLALTLVACEGEKRTVIITSKRDTSSQSTAAKKIHPNEIRGASTTAYKPATEGMDIESGGTAVLALLIDIDSFNPFTSSSAEAQEIHDILFPRLMREEANYNEGPPTFTPVLAESWTFGDDELSIRFKLRECTWSDGQPITSEDVRFTWQAAKHPDVAWTSATIVDFIQDIDIHSPREFTVRYSKKSPYQLMDINDIQILPKHAFSKIPFERWQKHGLWSDIAKVSGGPFMLESYTPNQEIAFVRNPKYWQQGKPYLDRVIFRIIGDMRTMVNTLLSGSIDAMRSIIPKDAGRVLAAGHLDLYTYVSRSYIYMGWNCLDPLFEDRRVRRAMTHAIDRENIAESLYYGYASVAGPHIITSMWASNKDIKPLPFDPSIAVTLLQEAGWTKNKAGLLEKDGTPFRFELQTNSGNPIRKQICEYVQANLRAIGIQVDIKLMDFNQWSAQLKKHRFQGYVGGWYIATKVDNKPTWHSTSAAGRFNYVAYKNDRVDAIIDEARVMSDFKKAKVLWDEFQVILDRDQPYTMLCEPRGLVAIDKRFKNVKVTSLRAYENIAEWWVPKKERKY